MLLKHVLHFSVEDRREDEVLKEASRDFNIVEVLFIEGEAGAVIQKVDKSFRHLAAVVCAGVVLAF
jgi:hypothetical protein